MPDAFEGPFMSNTLLNALPLRHTHHNLDRTTGKKTGVSLQVPITAAIAGNVNLHPTVYIAPYTTIQANALIRQGVIIRDHVSIGLGSFVGQGTLIHEQVEIGVRVFVGANVLIGENTTIGAGTHIEKNVKIGANVRIQPESVIEKDTKIPDWHVVTSCGEVYVREDAPENIRTALTAAAN